MDTPEVLLPSQMDGLDTCALHGEELESALLEDMCHLIGVQSYSVNMTDSLEMIGLDSLKRAQLKSILEQYYGADISPEFMFDVNTTFPQLVDAVDKQKHRKPIIREVILDDGEGSEEQPQHVATQYAPPERTFCQKFCCQIR